MAKLVLLVVGAAWAAVLIPPMLRLRVDNRPNSSVTDFRRQLNKLQSTATPARGSVRAMGRPLAQASSPLQRQAAGGRPGYQVPSQRNASLRGGGTATRQRHTPDHTSDNARFRSHGDATGAQRRPQSRDHDGADQARRSQPVQRQHPGQQHGQQHGQRRSQHNAQQSSRRPEPARTIDSTSIAKRRRTNVLFTLVVTAACTMFLAATTQSTAMLWLFGVSFLSLCGYVYVLAQLRVREDVAWNHGWLEQR